MTEHSERGRYVTERVSLWIQGDGALFEEARACYSVDDLRELMTDQLTRARRGEAGWHVLQELAPNDWARIDWVRVAQDLRGE